MKRDVTDEEIRRYLIGDFEHGAEEALERAYFADPDTLARVEVVEADLVDDYVAGRLPADVRERFERHYLANPEHRVEVELARSLRRRDSGTRSGAGQSRLLGIAAAVVLAVGGIALVLMLRGNNTAPAPGSDTSAKTTQPTQPSSRPGEPPATAQPSTVLATLTLSADAVRSDGTMPVLTASPEATHLELKFRSELAPDRLRAELASIDGGVVWTGEVLPVSPPSASPTGPTARVVIERSAVKRGDYVLSVLATAASATNVPQRFAFRLLTP